MQTNRYSTAQGRTEVFDAGLRSHLVNIYNRMTIGILITAVVAYVVGSSPMLLELFLGGPQRYIVMFAPLAVVWFGFNPASMSSKKLMMAFGAISVLYGISFSAIGIAFAGTEIARAFFITAGMFAGISIFGYTTKKDLSAMGQFCAMAVIGLVLTSVVGIFVTFSSTMQLIISVASVFIFAGVTAWQTQNMKLMYNHGHGAEVNSRLAWSAALTLYISFVAMFMNILSILQER